MSKILDLSRPVFTEPQIRLCRCRAWWATAKETSKHTCHTMYLRQASALAARRATVGSIRRLATGKDVKFGVEGRALMLQGVDKLADAVQVREQHAQRALLIHGLLEAPSHFPLPGLCPLNLVFWPMDPVDLLGPSRLPLVWCSDCLAAWGALAPHAAVWSLDEG